MVCSGPTDALPSAHWLREQRGPLAFGLALGVLLLGAFFAASYLPMVDLPQHAAQISIWQHLHDPQLPEMRAFELNLRTPYLGAYALARGLSTWLGVLPALKVVVWTAVVGHWAAFAWLVRQLRYPPWLGVLGLPLGMGYGFYFGFISFIFALPFGLCSVCLALRHRTRPTLASGLGLGAALCATLGTHGFALGLTLVLVAPLLLRGNGTLVARGVPLVAPALLILLWLMPGSSARSIGLTIWEPRVLELLQVPALLLAASGADAAATTFGVILLALIGLSFGRPSPALERQLPLLVLLLGYCLFPLSFGGFTPLHPRFAAFMVPASLLFFEPRRQAPRRLLASGVALSTLAWLGLFLVRLQRFERETEPVRNFVQLMPSNLRIRPLVFERESRAFPRLPTFLHLSAYYVPEKAGVQGYSFAQYPTSVIRYRPEVVPSMSGGAEWHPEWFDAAAEQDGYDCFLVHSERDRLQELFGTRGAELELVFREGDFWAYLTRSAFSALSARIQETKQREQSMVVSRSR